MNELKDLTRENFLRALRREKKRKQEWARQLADELERLDRQRRMILTSGTYNP